MYRNPKTTQERRANGRRDFLVIDGYVIRLRPCRNMANLVNSYDDIRRDWYKSWKYYRSKQYRQRE